MTTPKPSVTFTINFRTSVDLLKGFSQELERLVISNGGTSATISINGTFIIPDQKELLSVVGFFAVPAMHANVTERAC